ncbi:hypothetical protein PY650_23915 [Rhizobium calliandrae]|uniref:DUF982 domain-containing protein n=1 Tax=Rhizobium calliandrae TaxID=1312182 RepID=A0ABT7KJ29_9HYPH|nr:hypothetical protein [Rhizobium calliandrae]MDL2408636.1 hypothetical protein [Rhizobium calliandrae]
MVKSPAIPSDLSDIRAVFEEACERRGITQTSATANELAQLMLDGYASGLRDREAFYVLADIYP